MQISDSVDLKNEIHKQKLVEYQTKHPSDRPTRPPKSPYITSFHYKCWELFQALRLLMSCFVVWDAEVVFCVASYFFPLFFVRRTCWCGPLLSLVSGPQNLLQRANFQIYGVSRTIGSWSSEFSAIRTGFLPHALDRNGWLFWHSDNCINWGSKCWRLSPRCIFTTMILPILYFLLIL